MTDIADYAISAIGRNSGKEPLGNTIPGNEVVRFEEKTHGGGSLWDSTGDFGNQIRIIQEPSPLDPSSIKPKIPWDRFSAYAKNILHNFQNYWRNAMKDSDISDKFSMNAENTSLSSLRTFLREMRKSTTRIMKASFGMTLFSSIASLIKNSISTLYRQQG